LQAASNLQGQYQSKALTEATLNQLNQQPTLWNTISSTLPIQSFSYSSLTQQAS
jgi:hypothetical protein